MTQLDNVNRALAEIGTRSRLTVVDGSTTEGLYASLLYPMLRDSMLRMGDYDWAMTEIPTTPFTGGFDPLFSSWSFAYDYPVNCVRIRQATSTPEGADPFDPIPVEWNIYLHAAGRIVLSKVQLFGFIFTRNDCPEETWDTQFTDAFVRYLASAMTMALENRLEASETVLKNAMAFAGLANMRDD